MLKISSKLQDEVVAHCRSRYPKEACGYLLADGSGAVTRVQPMTNVEDSPIGYAMDPKEQLKAERQMRERNERLAAIYHSHTASAAYPSTVDVGLAISPEVSYVLVSLKDQARPDFKSYRIDGQTITPEEVVG
jgi:proteasome lid subunit RPN8/RPN11